MKNHEVDLGLFIFALGKSRLANDVAHLKQYQVSCNSSHTTEVIQMMLPVLPYESLVYHHMQNLAVV